ncbi:MAG: DUF4412 domain-containing protein [Bacteroidota bacterium]
MKSIMCTLCCLLTIGLLPLTAQKFEGVIKIKAEAINENINMVITVKGDMIHLSMIEEGSTRGMKMISNNETGEMVTLAEKDGKKVAIKMGADMIGMDGDINTTTPASENKSKITVTKDEKVIDGYKCIKVLGEDDNNKVVAWVAKDLKFSLFDLFPGIQAATAENGGELIEQIMKEGFALEVVDTDKNTKEVRKLVADVDEKKVDGAIFQYPESEYKIYDLGNMMEIMNDPEKMKELQEIMEIIGN